MKKNIFFILLALFIIFVLVQYFYGGSPNLISHKNDFEILAHRGVHTNWEKGGYDRLTGCEAVHIYEPTHSYIENTLESINAAFDMGATIVEIDIRRSLDNQLVVLHDDMLDCKTNGKGSVNDHSLEYLKNLDVGYGFTHDDGKTYPLRGKGVGKMPTLIEVLQAHPSKKFLIDHKDGSLETAKLLVTIIDSLPLEQQELLYYWGPDKAYSYIHQKIPAVTRLFATRRQMKSWFKTYLFTFGLSGFPKESRGLVLGMPPQYTKFLWGWPYRFLKDVHDSGAQFYLLIDDEEDARQHQNIPVDGIVTDYIENIGKIYQ